ncbi:Ca2+-binding actin-bundling protein (actinin), alpha chain (EF-Hand protein superfamily) [Cichlidogyrus casuarinus]|uniref:Ca2+-binding actin-bundling protein (Actinin), alpha chain (EF-Hand protein superfamily) n=1 Tax=Cichlidogyrus casuarinus TaxID=1844966 RepID=A0ABD2Q3H7_9PLAT
MGGNTSKALDEDVLKEISGETDCRSTLISIMKLVNTKQICRLYSRFDALDKSSAGYLRRNDLLRIPEIAINPLGDRIVNQFFENKEELNFHDYVRKLASFRKVKHNQGTVYSNKEAKLRFLFGMYDIDGDEKITPNELFGMLRLMVGSNISEDQVINIGDRTMAEADINGDGYITYEEFREAFENVDIEEKMSIKFME